MQTLEIGLKHNKVRKVRSLINSAGNKLFAVTFKKRGDGSIRKMVCRRHVHTPTYASLSIKKRDISKIMKDNNLITVFDTNKIRYNKSGRINGRGDWRCIPLDSVMRIKVGGEIYKIK